MYNYSYKLTYSADIDNVVLYQNDFLAVLNLTEFSYPKVCEKMDSLYNLYKGYFGPCIELIKKNNTQPFVLTDIMAFNILFSYDDLVETHQFLQEIHNNNTIHPNQNSLLLHLKTQFNK